MGGRAGRARLHLDRQVNRSPGWTAVGRTHAGQDKRPTQTGALPSRFTQATFCGLTVMVVCTTYPSFSRSDSSEVNMFRLASAARDMARGKGLPTQIFIGSAVGEGHVPG